MKKALLLAMGSLFFGFVACAETPKSVVNLKKDTTVNTASSVAIKNALVFDARCGEGPFAKKSEVYIAAEEGESHLYIGFNYEGGTKHHGYGIDDSLLKLYFANKEGVYSMTQTPEFDQPTWIYLALKDKDIDVDVNKIEEYESQLDLVKSRVVLTTNITSVDSFLNDLLNAAQGLTPDSGELERLVEANMTVDHNGHPHWPYCRDITWSSQVIQDYTFNLDDKNEDGEEHENHGDEDHDDHEDDDHHDHDHD